MHCINVFKLVFLHALHITFSFPVEYPSILTPLERAINKLLPATQTALGQVFI